MTVYTGGGVGTFIEVAVEVDEGYCSRSMHLHFREFDEVTAFFKNQQPAFFAVGGCTVEKCADEVEKKAIVELFRKCGDIALQRNQKQHTLTQVQNSAKKSREWLQFYNDVLSGAPHVVEMAEFNIQNLSYCETTAAQLEKDIAELTCD